jgi:hypothetical protein
MLFCVPTSTSILMAASDYDDISDQQMSTGVDNLARTSVFNSGLAALRETEAATRP